MHKPAFDTRKSTQIVCVGVAPMNIYSDMFVFKLQLRAWKCLGALHDTPWPILV